MIMTYEVNLSADQDILHHTRLINISALVNCGLHVPSVSDEVDPK